MAPSWMSVDFFLYGAVLVIAGRWLLLRLLTSSPWINDFMLLTCIYNNCKCLIKLLASKLSMWAEGLV